MDDISQLISLTNGLLVSTMQVILPTTPLMLAARDEAAEFDESDLVADMFTDDPR